MYFPTSKIASGEDITAGFRVPLVKQRNKTQFAEQEPGKGCIFSSFLYMSKQRNNEKLILCRLQCVVVLSLVYVAYDTYYFLVAVATRMSSFPHQQGPQHRKGDQEFHLKKENKRFFLSAIQFTINLCQQPASIFSSNENNPYLQCTPA